MPRIVNDPTHAVCPSFEDPEWEFLRQSVVNAQPGVDPLTMEEAAQQMKDAWARENQRKVNAWNVQQQEDLAEQGERDRVVRETEEARQAQQETEAEEMRKEADRKKPKLNSFDQERHIEKWVEARPAAYCYVLAGTHGST